MADNAKKFLFDNHDFDEEAMRKKLEAARRPTFSQDEMEASRLTGVEQGRKEGQREAMVSLEAQLCDLLQKIIAAAENFTAHEDARLARFIDHAAQLSTQGILTTVPILDDILSAEQVAAFIKDTLQNHAQKSDLIIYVHESTAERINTRLEKIKEGMPASGTWSVQAHPELSISECRIEWAGGGAEWNPERIHNAFLKAITDHLPEHLRPTEPETSSQPQTPAAIDENEQTPHNATEDNVTEAPKAGDE